MGAVKELPIKTFPAEFQAILKNNGLYFAFKSILLKVMV